MKSWAGLVLIIILVLAVVLAPIWVVASSKSFNQCTQIIDQNHSGFGGIHWLRIVTHCAGKLANDNQGAASAFAGGIGVIVALAVLVVYWHQADVMKLQARTMERQAEIMEGQQNLQRAWLIVGMGPWHSGFDSTPDIGPSGGPIVSCKPEFHNYGQTPAFVSYLDYAFCSDPPPPTPNWGACKRFPINNWACTCQKAIRIDRLQPSCEMTAPTIIYYGRLAYVDVLKRPRYCGFIYRWHRDDGEPNHERVGDEYPKYVEWK